MVQGFIFDLDGVITDTVEYHYLSWKRLADEMGMSFTRKDNDRLRGRSRSEALELFLRGRELGDDAKRALLERKNHTYLESIACLGPGDLLPGVGDLLREAKTAGLQLGIASASRNVRIVCESLGIIGLFDALGDGHSVVNAKPAPDIFLWVAGRLGLNPRECVVFEDGEAGVAAALAGGFQVVGIGPPQRVGRAHRVRSSLEGASVGEFTAD